jgi:hypothetical protein
MDYQLHLGRRAFLRTADMESPYWDPSSRRPSYRKSAPRSLHAGGRDLALSSMVSVPLVRTVGQPEPCHSRPNPRHPTSMSPRSLDAKPRDADASGTLKNLFVGHDCLASPPRSNPMPVFARSKQCNGSWTPYTPPPAFRSASHSARSLPSAQLEQITIQFGKFLHKLARGDSTPPATALCAALLAAAVVADLALRKLDRVSTKKPPGRGGPAGAWLDCPPVLLPGPMALPTSKATDQSGGTLCRFPK